jgi:plastocyanin
MRRIVISVGAAALLAAMTAAGHAMTMPSGPGPMAAPSGGRTASVAIEFAAYAPPRTTVLTGDTVTWSDVSREHTVTADDEAWSSPHMFYGDSFSHRFDAAGVYAYHCQIHTFMLGEVDVYDLLLDPPAAAAGPGRPYPIRGRTSLPQGTPVSIEADTGAAFATVASATVADDGTFAATVVPGTTATYRAVAGTSASPPVLLRVADRQVLVGQRGRGRHRYLAVRVLPATPGGTVVLQYHLRERFGWWPVAQARLDSHSTARLPVSLDRPAVSARVALTLPDGATQLSLSRTVRLRRQK